MEFLGRTTILRVYTVERRVRVKGVVYTAAKKKWREEAEREGVLLSKVSFLPSLAEGLRLRRVKRRE